MKARSTIRAGVIGIGSLGGHHARLYSSDPRVGELILYDLIPERSAAAAARWNGRIASSASALLAESDVVSICAPATAHYSLGIEAFSRGVHVLVEKPVAARPDEAEKMMDAARAAGRVLQVGHSERFNGAFRAAASLLDRPLFIESHRLGTFSPRGTDVSVVVDLMIHDIDLVLSLLPGDRVLDLRASGAGVLTGSPDIVNARLEFEGGCTANLTASRVSREPMRKMRFFQENLYVSADLKAGSVEAFRRADDVDPALLERDPTAFIRPVDVRIDGGEPLAREISSFLDVVKGGGEPVVTGADGLEALRVADAILERLHSAGERA